MLVNEKFFKGYSGNNPMYDLQIILNALISKDAKTYFEYFALKSGVENLNLKNISDISIINQYSSTRYFLDPLNWKNFVSDNSKEELAMQWYKNIANFEFLFSIIWQSFYSCPLKRCKWKGIELPCESIFSKSITDIGVCCSFNRERVDEIYVESSFTKIILELQQVDELKTPTQRKVPDWYTNKQEPKIQTGDNMGLYIEIDSDTEYLGTLSVNSDFLSQTILIGPSGKFFVVLLSNQNLL